MTSSNLTMKSTTENQREKRREERQPCFIPVDYAAQDRVRKDFIYNISPNGAFVESPSRVDIGTQILMAFEMMGAKLPVKSKGTIVHRTEFGFGVKFDSAISLPG